MAVPRPLTIGVFSDRRNSWATSIRQSIVRSWGGLIPQVWRHTSCGNSSRTFPRPQRMTHFHRDPRCRDVPPGLTDLIRRCVDLHGLRATAAALGVSTSVVLRVLAAQGVTPGSLALIKLALTRRDPPRGALKTWRNPPIAAR